MLYSVQNKSSNPHEDPCLYVLRYANNLEFGEKTHEVAMAALRLVQRMKKDNIHYGRRPSGLCGAALLMAARLYDFNRTVSDIVRIVHIHESTLRKRLVEFGETPSSSLTLEEFMNVDLEEEQDPPSYKAARAKDREKAERLQKQLVEEIEGTSQISELQVEIERQLEMKRALKRVVVPEEDLNLSSNERTDNVEEVDTDKFVTQSTLGVIKDCINSEETDTETTQPVGIGPTDALMGLERRKETAPTENLYQDSSGELDLEGIDDKEIDEYIMSERDSKAKDKIWMASNATYLKEQKEKEEKLAKEREEGKPEKKKRKYAGKKNKNAPAASTAGEAIEKMLQEKKISSKINYDVLKSLNVSFQDDGTSSNSLLQEPIRQTEPEIILPPPKSFVSRRSKATPRVQKLKEELKTEPVKIKEQMKEEIVPEVKIDHTVVAGETSDAEQDIEMEEYEEEVEGAEHTMSLSQMLNQHRGDDDNYYGYDDEDY